MIKKIYHGLQRTEEWHGLRLGRFTASEIYRLFKEPKTKKAKEAGEWSIDAWKYIKEKASEIIYQEAEEKKLNDAMIWGIENEPIASDYFASKMLLFPDEEKISFVEVGEFCGFSPDDTIEGAIPSEYKCPKNRLIHIEHLNLRTEEELFKYSKQKFYQIHFQIWGMDASHGYWSSFDPRLLNNEETAHKAIHTIKIQRNENLCQQFELKVKKAGEDRNFYIENTLK